MPPAASCLPLLLAVLAMPARAATFTVHDVRSAREVGESTQLFVSGRLVAAFHLGDREHEATVTVRVPDQATDQYRYDLCGTITIRSPQGTPETHQVSATGLLSDPDDRAYEALGAEDFTLFYLSDPSAPDAARLIRARSGLCAGPIS